MADNFEIQGVDAILDRFEGIASGENIYKAMGNACLKVEETAKPKAPKALREGGGLRNSIESKVETDGQTIKGVIFATAEYAPYVEYGTGLFAENGQGRKTGWAYVDEKTGETVWTRGQRPKPFLRPALYENKEKIIQMLKEGVNG